VAVDTDKTLKFYDFVDKDLKEKEEARKHDLLKYNEIIRATFAKYDNDQSGVICFNEAVPFVQEVLSEVNAQGLRLQFSNYVPDEDALVQAFTSIDVDVTGKINRLQLRKALDCL